MPSPLSSDQIHQYLKQLKLPEPQSHKGNNGKLIIIGGSELFHAASRWSLDIASKFVDMVFYASVPSNNTLIQEAKKEFWNGIVVPRSEIETYIEEADCVLIGPGMERDGVDAKYNLQTRDFYLKHPPSKQDWQQNTQLIVNYLLTRYPDKKWVIDAGALQMMDATLLTEKCIITPHIQELQRVLRNIKMEAFIDKITQKTIQPNQIDQQILTELNRILNQATILLKGPIDTIVHEQRIYLIQGGNAGMTKGGTGDVLAGLAAGLYSTNDLLPSVIVGSYINKKAGDKLHERVGPFYNATDLLNEIPQTLWSELDSIF